ncbi:MAG: EamA family transporter, partial [Planctomycetota bacterium]
GLIPLGAFGDPASLLQLDLFSTVILIISALTGIAMAHGLYYFAVQRIGAAISMFALMLAPFVSILCSGITLHQKFSVGQWIGGVVLLIGSTITLWSQQYLKPLEKAEAEVMEP